MPISPPPVVRGSAGRKEEDITMWCNNRSGGFGLLRLLAVAAVIVIVLCVDSGSKKGM